MNLLAELSTTESINLANFSFLSLLISMILYWVGTSFKDFKMENVSLNNPNNKQVSSSTGRIAGFAYQFGQYGIILSNILLGLLLALRWKESGHFPLSNLYESLMFLSWCFTGIHLFIEKSQETTKGSINKTLVGALTTPSALLTNAFATFTLPKEMQESSPLVPALQSNWLMMHVTVMIISYAALIIGSLLSIAFLIITFERSNDKEKKAYNFSVLNGNAISSALQETTQGTNPTTMLNNSLSLSNENDKKRSENQSNSGVSNKQQLSNVALLLDNLSYRILGIGFPFLTIGILSGAVWANEAWGSYWSWDPKETWALLTWLIFAIYLHTRLSKGWEGKKPAIIASFGFVIVWICYLGVNLLGEGLHSYGWITT